VLRVAGLSLAYDETTPVLDEASLAIDTGRFVSLVGPSGSGKSSLLRAIMGLQQPMAGRIDSDVGMREIGMLFQDDALLPWRSAADNVALGLRLRGDGRAQALAQSAEWLARLGLTGLGDRYPRALSGGQRKRVALAQVLALKPRLLLMDEPFASLDAITRARVTQDLLALVESERMTVLLVTHDLEEALALSDVVYLLSHGPRARISRRYEVPIPRPRDVVTARTHPAFAPLLEALWRDLQREVASEAVAA
jgi:NitT/TauT family transport system ATP-binding protein